MSERAEFKADAPSVRSSPRGSADETGKGDERPGARIATGKAGGAEAARLQADLSRSPFAFPGETDASDEGSSANDIVQVAEASMRANTDLPWDCHDGRNASWSEPDFAAREAMLATAWGAPVPAGGPTGGTVPAPQGTRRAGHSGHGDAYAFDGTLEGLLSAVHAAFEAHDEAADLRGLDQLQPRIDQQVIDVETDVELASKVRRLVEYCLGAQAFHCVRTASASEDSERGNIIYRFIRKGVARSRRNGCLSCKRKRSCTRACERPRTCRLLDDLADPDVFALTKLYRAVANERERMTQFLRFQHCAGDVWFARCNPNASVVPLLMDWFIPRFNDQRFVIYDENHAMSGVYDGERWYLVGGDAITPPPPMEDQELMEKAWRRFYRSVSVDVRYHPELRRAFMPMRLWRNLPELQPEPGR